MSEILPRFPSGKTVLLFSGGLDSYLIARLHKPDVLLRVKIGSAFEGLETLAIQNMKHRGHLDGLPAITEIEMPFLGAHERPDGVVPARNLFFTSAAALYGERLLLGAVRGDHAQRDKDTEFFQHSHRLLTHVFGRQRWCLPHKFKVEAPGYYFTKTELVRQYLEEGGSPGALLTSVSCLTPANVGPQGPGADVSPFQQKPCGACKSCLRKWTALINNGIDPGDHFAVDPSKTELAEKAKAQAELEQWRGDAVESADLLRALAAVRG